VLPSGGPVQRVAELGSEGGFVVRTGLQVPQVAVYSDGSVVLGADKKLTLDPGAYSALIGALRQDLKGQPGGVLQPTDGSHVVADIPSTVVAVRQADGSYQKVGAIDLADIGKKGGYPAPVYDAYVKLHALTSAPGATPYTFTRVRYGFQCVQPGAGVKPWPAGLPQPSQSQVCQQSHLVDGALVGVVAKYCQTPWSVGQPNQPAVVYRSSTGTTVACLWRYALPDETS
jgi:hypothetical protein